MKGLLGLERLMRQGETPEKENQKSDKEFPKPEKRVSLVPQVPRVPFMLL
jgi:hypothetical protein